MHLVVLQEKTNKPDLPVLALVVDTVVLLEDKVALLLALLALEGDRVVLVGTVALLVVAGNPCQHNCEQKTHIQDLHISVHVYFSIRTFQYTHISVHAHFSIRTFQYMYISVHTHFSTCAV